MADAIPTTMPDGHKAPNQRFLLTALPAAGATLILPVPHLSQAAIMADEDHKPPHPVLSLPFVRDRSEAEKAAGALPRCFWSVEPTGHYGGDCGTGGHYARLALDYMVQHETPYLFQWCIFDMMRLGRTHSGIEVGFLSVFGRISAEAHARRPASGAGEPA